MENFNDEILKKMIENRPKFNKRVVVTSGMPYGNKTLHCGHVGGLFIHADAFARFMRDRIGTKVKIGKNKITETVLTRQEFCSRLMKIRERLRSEECK